MKEIFFFKSIWAVEYFRWIVQIPTFSQTGNKFLKIDQYQNLRFDKSTTICNFYPPHTSPYQNKFIFNEYRKQKLAFSENHTLGTT